MPTPTPYGMFAAAGCITAVLWLKRHREKMGLTENAFWAGVWTMLLGATVGAKVLFVALGWEHYARGELRLWADFGVGFVFFGGLLGAAAAGGVFARLRSLSFVGGADYFAVAVPIGHAIRRVEAGQVPQGSAFWLYLLFYGALRVALDPLRADGRPERLLGLSPQQGLALAVIGVAMACSLLSRRGSQSKAQPV